MAVPYQRLTKAELVALQATPIGNLKPYQVQQFAEAISKVNYNRGSGSDVAAQPTITTIVATMPAGYP